jgi:hypothetical protein
VLRRASIAFCFVLVCVLVAGCGARSNKPFTATGSAACFAKAEGFKKVTTEQAKVGFIAGFAPNGGLRATATDGNVLTVAFAREAPSPDERHHGGGSERRPRLDGHADIRAACNGEELPPLLIPG